MGSQASQANYVCVDLQARSCAFAGQRWSSCVHSWLCIHRTKSLVCYEVEWLPDSIPCVSQIEECCFSYFQRVVYSVMSHSPSLPDCLDCFFISQGSEVLGVIKRFSWLCQEDPREAEWGKIWQNDAWGWSVDVLQMQHSHFLECAMRTYMEFHFWFCIDLKLKSRTEVRRNRSKNFYAVPENAAIFSMNCMHNAWTHKCKFEKQDRYAIECGDLLNTNCVLARRGRQGSLWGMLEPCSSGRRVCAEMFRGTQAGDCRPTRHITDHRLPAGHNIFCLTCRKYVCGLAQADRLLRLSRIKHDLKGIYAFVMNDTKMALNKLKYVAGKIWLQKILVSENGRENDVQKLHAFRYNQFDDLIVKIHHSLRPESFQLCSAAGSARAMTVISCGYSGCHVWEVKKLYLGLKDVASIKCSSVVRVDICILHLQDVTSNNS